MTTPDIFPIYLSENEAYRLVQEHAKREAHEATIGRFGETTYTYSAKVNENGDVELRVSYNSDSGFCLSSGTCLTKTVRPYSDEEFTNLVERKTLKLAQDEYYHRKAAEEVAAILAIQREMFPHIPISAND